MKNIFKSLALAAVLGVAAANEQEQQSQKSAIEQHNEAIEAQTQRWIDETKMGVPSQERIEELVAANRRIIQEIWEKEAERQANTRN
ncbi:MAG: hypothetical protein IKV03_01310 [Alphaproteobacteria bacterium]|nr:hypothetical protein [Alphaproteobacteria bacterium]